MIYEIGQKLRVIDTKTAEQDFGVDAVSPHGPLATLGLGKVITIGRVRQGDRNVYYKAPPDWDGVRVYPVECPNGHYLISSDLGPIDDYASLLCELDAL